MISSPALVHVVVCVASAQTYYSKSFPGLINVVWYLGAPFRLRTIGASLHEAEDEIVRLSYQTSIGVPPAYQTMNGTSQVKILSCLQAIGGSRNTIIIICPLLQQSSQGSSPSITYSIVLPIACSLISLLERDFYSISPVAWSAARASLFLK